MEESTATELLIEWPEQYGIQKASLSASVEQLKEESQKALNIAMSSIRAMADKVSRTIHDIELEARPDEVEVEFSLKLDLEAGAVIPMVAKTTAGGQFTVRFKWTLDKPTQAKVLVSPKE
jgi:hypothetical protein